MTQNLSHSKMSAQEYQQMRQDALLNPNDFWKNIAKNIDWHTDFNTTCDVSFDKNDFKINWFHDGYLNASFNAVDRHCLENADKVALIWESDCGKITKNITFSELKTEIEYFSAALRHMGVKMGDNVVIYMPMIPEAIFAMLACARIGAVHCVVFGGFSANALAERIKASQSEFIITADEGIRGGKKIPLKANLDEALSQHHITIKKCLVVQRTFSKNIPYNHNYDLIYADLKPHLNPNNGHYQIVPSEHPMFILYTSGSTGKPKGLVHSTGGYCVYTAFTYALSFDADPKDVFFCTADIGWITGHSYMVYGALLNGIASLIFEGTPTYPDAGRLWSICDQHKVSVLYTAPTALRSLMGQDQNFIDQHDLSSLRILGTVGEPINPQVYHWYQEKIGRNQCPIIDTWWQTETGGHMIASPAFLAKSDAGVAGLPYPALDMAIVSDDGTEIQEPNQQGALVIKNSWPGQARTIHADQERFFDTYFSQYPNCYFTGDGAFYTSTGDIHITGRIDDVLNVSGHRMGTAELESALVAHEAVAEAAIVAIDHKIKGQAIYAYVTLMQGLEQTDDLIASLKQKMRQEIGAIATPEVIRITKDMPKTRSGKIMRRILRKIATGDTKDLGDLSTLANPETVHTLIDHVS